MSVRALGVRPDVARAFGIDGGVAAGAILVAFGALHLHILGATLAERSFAIGAWVVGGFVGLGALERFSARFGFRLLLRRAPLCPVRRRDRRRPHAVVSCELSPPRARSTRYFVQKLVRGIHQFRANYFASHRALFKQLATAGQRPETLFITCSDSRVVPNLITSCAPGELFIVRNVGNVVPPYDPANAGATSAALEYAVCVLKVENIIVCGHTSCGAMNALLEPDSLNDLPHVARWLRHAARLRDLLASRYSQLEGDARLTAAAEENVLVQLEHLRGYPFIAKALDEHRLQMNGWVFKIATGQVFDFDPEREEFVQLASESDPVERK